MSTEDGRYTIAFNGEIYNFVEVRKELEAKGAIFRTRSDTEVILQGYAVWGERCLDKMIGMFAFAIWDREEEELFLARDRVGKKPLVYFWDGKTFAFASETKGLVGAGLFDPKLDAKSVDLFFALGWVPSPLSIFMYVRKLQPGHFMKFKDGRVEIKRYWFPEKLLSCDKRKKEDRLQDFKSLFANAVNIRLRSDVPIGIFLSGGIDSSVVALEAVSQGYSAHALTVFFDHDRIDVNYAVKVARLLGIPQECIEVHGNICDDLEDIFWHYDEPFADTSSIPTFYIARAAKDRFKVILNGDGGDELFGGYRRYERIRMRYFLKRMASCLGLRDGGSNALQIWFGSRAIFREHERKALLKGRLAGNILRDFLEEHPFLSALRSRDILKTAMLSDRSVYLPDDLLYKMDIALSAFGTEGRSPFLDHRLLEWGQSIPSNEIVKGSEKKLFLRKAMRSRLPDEILDRPKHGFGSPVGEWLRGPLAEMLEEYIPCPLLEKDPQRELIRRFSRERGAQNQEKIWCLFAFSVWAKRFNAYF